jgi:hypothetical protein
MKKNAITCLLISMISTILVAQDPIALTPGSFNFDCVAEATPPSSYASAMPYNDCLYAEGSGIPGIGTSGMPASNTITTGAITYNLQPYNGNNSLQLGSSTGSSGTMTLASPVSASELHFLATSVGGAVNVNIVVNFSDNTSQQIATNFTVQDWFNGSSVAYVINGRYFLGGGYAYDVNSGNPRLYTASFPLSPANHSKSITSVTITRTSVTNANHRPYFFALSGTIAGCPDDDNDGVCNADDQCPNDPNKTAPGACGCGVADVATTWYSDTDGDGAGDPNNSISGYTCIQPEGYVAGNEDGCPNDPNKTAPGVCGCGVADTDTDGDGVADCNDNCIETANSSQEDSDGDGIGNVCDACPNIPDPACATCGNGKYLVCHVPEGNPENAQQLCVAYNSALVHVGNHGGCFWGVCNPAMASNPGSTGIASIQAQRLDASNLASDDRNPLVETANGATYYFDLSPNPASSSVTIHLHGHSKDAYLYIHDQLGRMVWNQAVSEEESSFNLSLQDHRFGNGMYLVTLVSNGDRITRRLIVSK